MADFYSKYTGQQVEEQLDKVNNKQDILVSGENVKTINGSSILGKGDITVKSATPDWNAKEGEDGYIKNRTHVENVIGTVHYKADYEDFSCFNIPSIRDGERLLSITVEIRDYYGDYLGVYTYDGYLTYGEPLKFYGDIIFSVEWADDVDILNISSDIEWEGSIDVKVSTIDTLPDKFLSSNIVRKSDLENIKAECSTYTWEWNGYTTGSLSHEEYNSIKNADIVIISMLGEGTITSVVKTQQDDDTISVTLHAATSEELTNYTFLFKESGVWEMSLDYTTFITPEQVDTKLKSKADKDGIYTDMTVGKAANLLGVAEGTPAEITFRSTDGNNSIEDGIAAIESIKGNSVVWNQMLRNDGESVTINGVTITKVGNEWHCSGIATADVWFLCSNRTDVIVGHKYLYQGCPNGGSVTTYMLLEASNYLNVDEGNGSISTANVNGISPYIVIRKGVDATGLVYRPTLVDLTKMFGEGNEPTTIAEFYSRIPMGVDLNAYNEGEIINNCSTGIKTRGFNAWDEQWEKGIIGVSDGQNYPSDASIRTKNFIRILPNTEYYKSCPTLSFYWHIYFDQDKKFIGYAGHSMNNKFTTPPNAYYMKSYSEDGYGNTYKNDICINLVHTGYRNGEYEPYVSDKVSLPTLEYFPNGMCGRGNVCDELQPNKAIKRFGEVNLGSLAWNYSQGVFITYISDMKGTANTNVAVMAKYSVSKSVYGEELYDNVENKVYKTNGGAVGGVTSLAISDSDYTDATTFKAAMQGVKLYYELAEPIETEIEEPFDTTYSAWDFGTEEAISSQLSAPLKADIIYKFNARDTIRQDHEDITKLNERVNALETTLRDILGKLSS